MIKVGGRDFVPFKCAGNYLGGFSETWMKDAFTQRHGGPSRVYLSDRKSGWYKSDLDKWLRRRPKSKSKRAA